MRLLLDTHAFIWWDSEPDRLSATALAAIRDPANEVNLSVASVWEMVIKSGLGKLSLRMPLADIVLQQAAGGLRILPVTHGRVLAVEQLPLVHRDPFDRVLVAQATMEDAELVGRPHLEE